MAAALPEEGGAHKHLYENIKIDDDLYYVQIECHGDETESLIDGIREKIIGLVRDTQDGNAWDRLVVQEDHIDRIKNDATTQVEMGPSLAIRVAITMQKQKGTHVDSFVIERAPKPPPPLSAFDWYQHLPNPAIRLTSAQDVFSRLNPIQREDLEILYQEMQAGGRSLSVFQRACAGSLEKLLYIAASVKGNAPFLLGPPADGSAIVRCLDAFATNAQFFETQSLAGGMPPAPPYLPQLQARNLLAVSRTPSVPVISQILGGINVDGGKRINIACRGTPFRIDIGHIVNRHTVAHYNPDEAAPAADTSLWPVHMEITEVLDTLRQALDDIIRNGGGAIPQAFYGTTRRVHVSPPGRHDTFECGIFIANNSLVQNLVVTFYPIRGPGVIKVRTADIKMIHKGFEQVRLGQRKRPQYQ